MPDAGTVHAQFQILNLAIDGALNCPAGRRRRHHSLKCSSQTRDCRTKAFQAHEWGPLAPEFTSTVAAFVKPG